MLWKWVTSMNIIGVQASACVLFVNDPWAEAHSWPKTDSEDEEIDDKTHGKGMHPRNHRMPYVAHVLFSG